METYAINVVLNRSRKILFDVTMEFHISVP
jgi:hypothetical protein